MFSNKLKEEGIGDDLLDLQQIHYIVDPHFFDRTFTRMEDESENEIMTGRMKNSEGHSVAFNINFKSLWRAKLKAAVRLLKFQKGTSVSTTRRHRNSSLGTRQENYEEEDSSYLDEEDSYEDNKRMFDTPCDDDDDGDYEIDHTEDYESDDDDDVGQGEITPPSEFSPTHLMTPMNKRGNKTRRTRREKKRYQEIDLNTPASCDEKERKKMRRQRRRRDKLLFEKSHTDNSLLPQGCVCVESCVLL